MKQLAQDNIINFIKDITLRESRKVAFLGYKVIIHKNVFPIDSSFSLSSKIMAKRIPENAGIVLDVGTGTGIQAIIAAEKGAKKVLAIDIDDDSLENAEVNVTFHKLDKVVEVRRSDLFENIKKEEKFDLVLANIPLADVNYTCKFGHFLFDAKYILHKKLLKGLKNHLFKGGKILIPSGDVANEERLIQLIKRYNFNILKIDKEIFQNLTWKLYTLTNNI